MARNNGKKPSSTRYEDGYDYDYGERRPSKKPAGKTGAAKKGKAPARKKSSKKSAAKKKRRVILFTVEILLLAVMLVVLYGVMKGTQTTKFNISEEDITINEQVKENETMQGYWNIALFGVDARDNSLGKGNRTDTIMVASINRDTGEVKLVSLFRDTYLNLGNDSYGKCNSAYAKGGPELAINMLNMNLDLDITQYVTVGFKGVIDTIDALGGIEIDVKENEISHLNNYQISIVGRSSDGKHFEATPGTDYTPVTKSGLQTLNGLQATAYCRIRYVGDDYARTERQRTVLMKMAEKAKTANPAQLNKILNSVFPSIQTNFDITELTALISKVGDYSITQGDGFPFSDSRTAGNIGSRGSFVVPLTLEKNVVALHKFLFDNENYEPSPDLKKYSEKVLSDTSKYVGGPSNSAPEE